jgi:hypothetical protein
VAVSGIPYFKEIKFRWEPVCYTVGLQYFIEVTEHLGALVPRVGDMCLP